VNDRKIIPVRGMVKEKKTEKEADLFLAE